MSRPRIAICVVTFNSVDLIEDMVASLPDGARDTEWTLVVADNASHDGTVAEVRRCAPAAILVETGGNLGYAAGVNAAVRAAGEQDAYLILNADVRLEHGCLATLYASLSPTVGLVVPKLLDAHGEIIWSMRREPTLTRAWADAMIGAERAGKIGTLGEIVTDAGLYSSARPTDWAEGSTQLMSAACSRACGEWDASYFLYSEETDFDLRARDHGYTTLYQPDAVATHLEGGSAGSPALWSLVVMNRVRLYSRRHGPVRASLFWLATATREASRTLLGKATSRAALRDLVSRRRWREKPSPEWLQGVHL